MTQATAKKSSLKVEKQADNAIYLLSSETNRVVVQTQPSLVIHAICPPATRELLVDYKKRKTENTVTLRVRTPTLLWSQIFTRWKQPHYDNGMCQCMGCMPPKEGHRDASVYYLHTVNLSKCKPGYIHGATFCMGNCDSHNEGGWVCFGSNRQGRSLRHSNGIYWGSIFNNSPNKYPIDAKTDKERNEQLAAFMKKYRAGDKTKTDVRNIAYHNLYEYIFGKQSFASSKGVLGVFMSFDKQLLEQLPDEALSNGAAKRHEVKAIIGLANRAGNSWVIDLPSGNTIQLEDEQVVVH